MLRFSACVALASILMGCSAQRIVRETSEAAAIGVVKAAGDPRTAKALERAISSEAAQKAQSAAAASLVDAGLETLSNNERLEQVSTLAGKFSTAIAPDLGAAMQHTIETNVGPAAFSALGTDGAHRAIGELSRIAGREFVLGMNDALIKIQEDARRDDGKNRATLFSKLEMLLSSSTLAILACIAACAAVLFPLAFFFINARKRANKKRRRIVSMALKSAKLGAK